MMQIPKDPDEAVRLQLVLRDRVRVEPLGAARLIAGCDVAYATDSDDAYGAIVVLELPSLNIAGWSTATGKVAFPYISGLLSFREMPLLLKAWEGLSPEPEVVIVDGQGLAHPRRFGLACHLGVLTDTPCFGCAKTPFVGEYQEPNEKAGCFEYIVDNGEVVGAVLRTRDQTAPVFVSPGHRIDLAGSIDVTLQSMRASKIRVGQVGASGHTAKAKYRIPEPTRLANIIANALRRGDCVEKALRLAGNVTIERSG